MNYLPIGLKGLVIASFFAAFLTTLDTRMNLGASYFVNDFYKPFVVQGKDEKHYLMVSRLVTLAQLILSYGVLLIAQDVRSLFFVYVGVGSGSGLVYILRFYWWRISAWSEISAMAAALIMMIIFRWGVYGSEEAFTAHGLQYMFISLVVVTLVWLTVTFLTTPTSKEKLKSFFRTVRPAGPFWKPVSEELKEEEGIVPEDNLKVAFIGWIFSNPMTLGYLFGIGNFLMGRPTQGVIWLIVGIYCTFVTVWSVKKITRERKG